MLTLPADLTVTEAVQLSGYTRVHVYHLINEGKLKTRRAALRAAGVIILIDRGSLEDYLRLRGRVDGKAASKS